MMEICQLEGSLLRRVQPNALKMEYELRADEQLAATLSFRSPIGTFATARSSDGCWTFKRAGILQTRATIRFCGSDNDLATFRNNPWTGGGTLELHDGRTFLATTNLWQSRLEIKTTPAAVWFG
jgi:hypothetical protein